jgi:hypothetical protein
MASPDNEVISAGSPSESFVELAPPPVKRGRGRPKKPKPEEIEISEQGVDVDNEGDEEEDQGGNKVGKGMWRTRRQIDVG